MMSFRTVTAALLALGATAAVHANPVEITNATDQTMNIKMRCSSPQAHEWKFFHAGVGEHGTINQRGCQRYSFELTTIRKGSGMEVTVKYSFAGGTRHKLIWDPNKRAFDSRKLQGSPA